MQDRASKADSMGGLCTTTSFVSVESACHTMVATLVLEAAVARLSLGLQGRQKEGHTVDQMDTLGLRLSPWKHLSPLGA